MIQLKVVAEIQCDRCGRAMTASAATHKDAKDTLREEGWHFFAPPLTGEMCAPCAERALKDAVEEVKATILKKPRSPETDFQPPEA